MLVGDYTRPADPRARPHMDRASHVSNASEFQHNPDGSTNMEALVKPGRVWTPPRMQAVSLVTVGHVVRCGRVSGLEDAAFQRRGPVWRYADRDHFAYPRSEALRPECWFARSGLVTVCPYVPFAPLTSATSTRRPWPTRPPPPDPDRLLRCASAPRRSAPCGWPAPPRPACAACAPASAPATTLPERRCEQPTSRRRRRR